jgi:hypothetical protein
LKEVKYVEETMEKVPAAFSRLGATDMASNAHIFGAVLCLVLGACSSETLGESTTLPATTGAATSSLAATPTSAAPVFVGVYGGIKYQAMFEIPNRDGTATTLYLQKGETLPYNNATILDINPNRVRISRLGTAEGGEAWVEIPVGYNADGQAIWPPRPQPATPPANSALSTDELFAKCLAATGTDYAEAKAVLVSRPAEAAAAAKKALENKEAPWQNRVIARALLEELADPKAFAAARMELIRVACAWRNIPPRGEGEYRPNLRPGEQDPREVYRTAADNLYKLIAPYPGLCAEITLKATADSIFPLVVEVVNQDLRRRFEEWKSNPNQQSYAPPPQSWNAVQPDEPNRSLRFVRSQAALACAKAPTAETRSLLQSLDPKEYASVLADCDRILQEAATKPATNTQPTSSTKPTTATSPAK